MIFLKLFIIRYNECELIVDKKPVLHIASTLQIKTISNVDYLVDQKEVCT